MKRALAGLLLCTLVACHAGGEPKTGTIDSVSIVLVGADEPLPFDPRGGRLTIVTRQIESLVGHPVVLELDTALSPQLKVSLEESVLASLENVARELVQLKRDAPAAFSLARSIVRIRCRYDAVAERSDGKLVGEILEVKSPPRQFPLLDRGLFTHVLVEEAMASLMKQWGDADPTQLGARDQETWFEAMTLTRPGWGYVWSHTRARGGDRTALRAEHLERILRLADVVAPGSLRHRVEDFLLTEGAWIQDSRSSEANPRVHAHYVTWLSRSAPSFDDAKNLKLANALYRDRYLGDPKVPTFDVLAFGLSVYDGWVRDGAPVPVVDGPRGELQKTMICPSVRRGESETEIRYGCSSFFADALRDEKQRARLAARIESTHDTRLLDQALLNLEVHRERREGSGKPRSSATDALALLDLFKDPALFHHGFRVLFDDHRRRDDVQSALEAVAFDWWRDVPARRHLTLLVLGRRRAALHPHYQDSQWEMTVKELGGPIEPALLQRLVAEGAEAVAMVPTMWKALARSNARDVEVAKALPILLDRDLATREMRATPALVQLHGRLCDERNASGLALVRSSLQGWAAQHPAEAVAVSNAIADSTIARCARGDTAVIH